MRWNLLVILFMIPSILIVLSFNIRVAFVARPTAP